MLLTAVKAFVNAILQRDTLGIATPDHKAPTHADMGPRGRNAGFTEPSNTEVGQFKR